MPSQLALNTTPMKNIKTEKKEVTNEEFFIQKLAYEVWYDTYKWETDLTIYDTFRRTAKSLASHEKEAKKWEETYFDMLSNLNYVPGGRIISNAGTGLKGTSWINCFVSGFKDNAKDSIGGIYGELKRQALILKSEGGYGFCSNVMRPAGAYIKGIGSETPGAVEFLNLWDVSSAIVTKGNKKKKNKNKGKNKIRKGAQMVTMSCWHPDIEEFVTAKQQKNKLTKFNMSVLVHDDFMKAVEKNEPWSLEFPETNHPKYDKEWEGDLYAWKEKGYPTKVYHTYENANELWELITKSTYKRNEPGIIFIDRANFLNNLYYCEKFDATNPCGEQLLPHDGSCNLGAINLVQYVLQDRSDFDYKKLETEIPKLVRFQDSVNDLTNFPLEEQRVEAQNKRRVGIGYMGYGSALFLLKVAYGSKRALKMTEKLCSFIVNHIYQASANLAKEKGAFPLFNKEKFLESNFVKQALWPETVALISKYGLRNSHLTTCAPTGNTGVFARVVSGGLEPVISHSYIRTVIVPFCPEGLELPDVDWDILDSNLPKASEEGNWEWTEEGDEKILRTEFKGTIYKFDKNRGLTKEEEVSDYAVLEMGDEFFKDKEKMGDKFYGKTINDLTVEDHISTMAVFAKYIDSSISKTINVPNDYSYEDFKNVYTKAYKSGTIKGITTYRWGTMTSVISSKDEVKKDSSGRPDKIIQNHAPKRPKDVSCDIHITQIRGEKWNVVVGKLDEYPFEIFAGKQTTKLPDHGKITKKGSGKYILETEGHEPINLVETFGEHGSYVYSKLLQHGTPLWSIVDMCDKFSENVLGFNKAMGRIIKKYIKQEELKFMKCTSCKSSKVVFQEGCLLCQDCGHSKCS
jgi:ribonucleoside-diphosphate reductase alpha chain